MARTLYAGRPGDTVVTLFDLGDTDGHRLLAVPTNANGETYSITLTVWDEPDGTQLTDLLAADGTTPITAITIPAGEIQIPAFYGPDGVTGDLWLRDPEGDYTRVDIGPVGPAGSPGEDGADGVDGTDGAAGVIQTVNGKTGAHVTITASDITTGTLPTSVLPPLAINETSVVASQAAMLALTAERGDMAVRTDNGRTYVLAAEPASTLANWREVLAAGQVQSVNSKTGAVVLTASDVGAATTAQGTKADGAAQKSANLSDVANAATARSNLGAAANILGGDEISVAFSALTGAVPIDAATGSIFYNAADLTGNITLALNNISQSGRGRLITVYVKHNASLRTVAFSGATLEWQTAIPTGTASKRTTYHFQGLGDGSTVLAWGTVAA